MPCKGYWQLKIIIRRNKVAETAAIQDEFRKFLANDIF
jgi:hypothetical protein